MCVWNKEGLRLLLIRLKDGWERQGGTDRVDGMNVGLREVSRLERMETPINRHEQGERSTRR
jgi:hypothetical protein